MTRLSAVVSALAIVGIGCSGSETGDEADGAWRGSITTEGAVTTVVTESGSVWGGATALVEEASIGVEAGEEPYMLGNVASVVADDERIYVLDTQPPKVRVYDLDGEYVRDIGAPGQGPGEFQGSMMSMVISPAGDLIVRDDNAARVSTFSSTGELLDTWALPGGFRTVRESVATLDGTLYVPRSVARDPRTGLSKIGMVPYDAAGNAGDPLIEPHLEHEPPDFPPIVRDRPGGGTRRTIMPIPFMPRPAKVLSPIGAWVVGVGSSYRFEVHAFDGSVTVVERRVAPFRVSSAEADARRHRTAKKAKTRDPGWTWNGPDIPDHKPFFDDLHADQSGRVWVRRRGPSIRIEDCDPAPPAAPDDAPAALTRVCWRDQSFFDVFGDDGRYLGEVEFPPFFRPFGGGFGNVYMRGDLVLMEVEDDAGTPMVKRYRLVPPAVEVH